MKQEQTTTAIPSSALPQATTPVPAASPTAAAAAGFVPPRLTKVGKVATITQDGLGGSLSFP